MITLVLFLSNQMDKDVKLMTPLVLKEITKIFNILFFLLFYVLENL